MSTHAHAFTMAIVHAEPFLRHSLAALFTANARCTVQWQADNGPALKRAAATGHLPGLVLLCLDMACALDHALLRWMARHMPHARLLLLGRLPAPAELPAALCAGAHGYFCMRDGHEQLLATAGLVLQGLLCFPADTHRALGQWQPPPQALAATALRQPSPAHREFLRWVAHPAGLAYADIARRMGRSERAVEKYRAVLFKRHGIKSRMGLVYLARQLGLGG